MKYTSILFVILLVAACDANRKEFAAAELYDSGNSTEASSFYEVTKDEAQENGVEPLDVEITQSSNTREQEKPKPANRIIKTAHYKYQVDSVEGSTKRIEQTLMQHNAFVADMNMATTSTSISNTFIIRVPAEKFEALLEALGKEAQFVNYKKISTEDVSEEFIDIQTRLKAKKEVHDRYIDILRNKAKTVKDILEAENQIRIIQEEIESKEGRLRFLQNRTAMSTIHLEIYQKVNFIETPDTIEKEPYLAKLTEGFSNGWSIITSLVLALVNIWPITLIGAVLIWKRKWVTGRLRRTSSSVSS